MNKFCLADFYNNIPTFRSNEARAAFIKDKLWDKTSLTYSILDDFGRDTRCIDKGFKKFSNETGGLFKFKKLRKNKESADITISLDPKKGNVSVIGKDSSMNKPSMNIKDCKVEIVMHEIGHALGMIHEHQNPRENPIKWDKPYVYDSLEKMGISKEQVDDDLFKTYNIEETNGSVFDPNSIMIYAIPSSFTLNNIGIEANKELSELDLFWLSKNYVYNKEDNMKRNNMRSNEKDEYSLCLADFKYPLPGQNEANRLGVDYKKLQAAFQSSVLWKKTHFTYSILDNFGRDTRCIDNAVKVLQKTVDDAITFKKLPNGDKSADITITMAPGGGNWSHLGTNSLSYKPSMNIGQCVESIVIHEFCHALGMIHEHQNPRGNPIKWNKPVVYETMGKHGFDKSMVDVNLFNRMSTEHINGSDFDSSSIMIYDIPPQFTTDGFSVRRNLWLSDLDKKWIKQIYKLGKPLPGLSPDIGDNKTIVVVIIIILLLVLAGIYNYF